MKNIIVYGPNDKNIPINAMRINTTSHSNDWSRGLSPFFLGPIWLYGNNSARIFENAYQYSKVYSIHTDALGNPSNEYFEWAKNGWNSNRAIRYPMGKGIKPKYMFWDDKKYNYVEGRINVYFPLYRDAVRKTEAFKILKQKYLNNDEIYLFDFDGYMENGLSKVILNSNKSMGHAFVLKSMLLYGDDVTVDFILDRYKYDQIIL